MRVGHDRRGRSPAEPALESLKMPPAAINESAGVRIDHERNPSDGAIGKHHQTRHDRGRHDKHGVRLVAEEDSPRTKGLARCI